MAAPDPPFPSPVVRLPDCQLNWEHLTKGPEQPHLVGGINEPAFANSWVNFGASPNPPAQFYRRGGRVYLDGYIKSGTVGTPAFTLPTGYRPKDQAGYAVYAGGAFGWTVVNPNGDVILALGSNTLVTLSGLSFRVA